MLADQRGVFLNIIKWFFLATLIGVVVGIADAMFLFLLDYSMDATGENPLYFMPLPFVFYLVFLLSKKIAPKSTDYSTDAAINKINSYRPVDIISTIKAFFLPILTISFGGSAGKEAPCADVGAGLGSLTSRIFRLSTADRRKLMICGVSAGFAGVFGVPISGAIFGLEVLWVGFIFYEVMFPAFVAGITAYQVTSFLGVKYVYHPITVAPVFSEGFFIKVLFAGIIFGLVSLVLIEVMKFARVMFRFISFKYSAFWKCFIGGSILVLVGLVISPDYLGLGMDQADAVLHGAEPRHTFGFLIKIFTTSITFAAGGVGGAVTPIIYIGAQAGSVMSTFLELDPATVAALGVVSVLAGTTNAPLAASIMAIELFGTAIAPYAAVSCVISFMMTGSRTIFSKQRISIFSKDALDDKPVVDKESRLTQATMPVKRASIIKLTRHLIPHSNPKEKNKKKKN
ncbi:H+/Cl- antiporter ClcA [Elusimicrobium posterum]|uniref:chloride channel protein n=1 Tax=Elusimicrobium posterum TaxID=3116653 RepID=UPI003C748A57